MKKLIVFYSFVSLLTGHIETSLFSQAGYIRLLGGISASEKCDSFKVGTGKAEITGALHGPVMMGYADTNEKTEGLHTRLYARAIIMQNVCGGEPIVIVSAELGMTFFGVFDAVLRNTREAGLPYQAKNLLLSSTHTHATPGGYSLYGLYNVSIGGFYPRVLARISTGITRAIMKAHQHFLSSGDFQLKHIRSGLPGGACDSPKRLIYNRSLVAHRQNPRPMRCGVPESFRIVKVTDKSEKIKAVLISLPVHNTGFRKNNKLVSSDHQGYASRLIEADLKRGGHEAIAVFIQGAEGDLTVNRPSFPDTPKDHGFSRVKAAGEQEAALVLAALQKPGESIRGQFRAQLRYYDFEKALHHPFLGYSFAAGAEDGRGPLYKKPFVEGMTCATVYKNKNTNNVRKFWHTFASSAFASMLTDIVKGTYARVGPCMEEKPNLIPGGEVAKLSITQTRLPVSYVTNEQWSLIGVPFEMTAESGLRLRQHLASASLPAEKIWIAGLANSYGGYMTTPEEYASQQYEGASTMFGKNSLPVLMTIVSSLRLRNASLVYETDPPSAEQLLAKQAVVRKHHPVDALPALEPDAQWGEILRKPAQEYTPGQMMRIVIRAPNPENSLDKVRSLFQLTRANCTERGCEIANDDSFSTTMTYDKKRSALDIRWMIPPTIKPGTIQFSYKGYRRWRCLFFFQGLSEVRLQGPVMFKVK